MVYLHRLSVAAFLMLQLAVPGSGQAAADPDSGEQFFRQTQLSPTVSMLQGRGGNLAVSHGPDGILVVDSDFADLSPALVATLKQMGEGPIRFLLNTHWHGDHTGGNAALGAFATIIAHDNVRQRVSTEQQRPIRGGSVAPVEKQGWPVVTFGEGLSVHFNGEVIALQHLAAGHTDGDAVVTFNGSGVVHLGDLFFSGRFPFIDLDTGGTVDGYIGNVGKLVEQLPEDITIIPGHGPLSGLDDLRAYHDMLVSTARWSQQLRQEGLTLTQVIARGLPAKWHGWGDGFINEEAWITTLYRGLNNFAE